MKNYPGEIAIKKLPYVAPTLEIVQIELECSIAAGSAMMRTKGSNFEVYEEWEEQDMGEKTINF
ncbi:hypothetical protein PQ465_18980 [Sphingobacterium oryzagri]|uniref:Uncharacterized protein n=1 Tax=Sphingobacterium oryzagri TaxID=3025669 RepID=A0ABY7WIE8_9SPHI|nr:hypothetical protein [Sphingobacterium sp. KACC 22765]WDF68364.1 hypothetical protein PQ465_18980 [Sphingobacterium sp. KACC 22765]